MDALMLFAASILQTMHYGKPSCWTVARALVRGMSSARRKTASSLPVVLVVRRQFIVALVNEPVSRNCLFTLAKFA